MLSIGGNICWDVQKNRMKEEEEVDDRYGNYRRWLSRCYERLVVLMFD